MRRSIIRATLFTLVLAFGFLAGQMSARQPHMNTALKHLRSAKNDLQRATPDKGGHREQALDFVNRAIDQVERGISYDRRH